MLEQRRLDSAWVLMFNVGTEDEATYMLQDRLSPTSEQLLLAFELQEDALRFSQQLEAEGFPGLAQPMRKKADYLRGFCDNFELRMSLVPVGLLALPPTFEQQEACGGLKPNVAPSAFERMRKFIEDRFYDI